MALCPFLFSLFLGSQSFWLYQYCCQSGGIDAVVVDVLHSIGRYMYMFDLESDILVMICLMRTAGWNFLDGYMLVYLYLLAIFGLISIVFGRSSLRSPPFDGVFGQSNLAAL